MDAFRRIYDRVLEAIAVVMIVAVTVIVCSGFIARELGQALVWYDEIASISLAWLTYYGTALAALRGGHIGSPDLLIRCPPGGASSQPSRLPPSPSSSSRCSR